jgi:hypothetical protein
VAPPCSLPALAARAGRRDEALPILQGEVPPAPPVLLHRRLIMIYACLGHEDRAPQSAEKMYAEPEPPRPTFVSYPAAAWLRTDPQFTALRQRIGLPN